MGVPRRAACGIFAKSAKNAPWREVGETRHVPGRACTSQRLGRLPSRARGQRDLRRAEVPAFLGANASFNARRTIADIAGVIVWPVASNSTSSTG
jgi:hypothetical protein